MVSSHWNSTQTLSYFLRDVFLVTFWRDKANPMCLSWKCLKQMLVSHGSNPLLHYADPNPQDSLDPGLCTPMWAGFGMHTAVSAGPGWVCLEVEWVPPREQLFFEVRRGYHDIRVCRRYVKLGPIAASVRASVGSMANAIALLLQSKTLGSFSRSHEVWWPLEPFTQARGSVLGVQ